MKYYERRHYNELFEETGNLNVLNGYLQEDYREIRDYRTVVYLLRLLNKKEEFTVSSVIDIGCGNGLLLKYIRESIGEDIIPYGCDYNALAIELLKEQVLPQFAGNFTHEDVNQITRVIDQDVAIIMHGDYSWNRLSITSPYIILRIRENLDDHPMKEDQKQAIIRDEQRLENSKRLSLLQVRPSTHRHSFRLYENLNNDGPFY